MQGKRKPRSNSRRKSKEITAGCPHSSLPNPPFLSPSLPATPQPSTLQSAALMSNITHATIDAKALIISERERESEKTQPQILGKEGGTRKDEDNRPVVILF